MKNGQISTETTLSPSSIGSGTLFSPSFDSAVAVVLLHCGLGDSRAGARVLCITALCSGVSLCELGRMTGHHRTTIERIVMDLEGRQLVSSVRRRKNSKVVHCKENGRLFIRRMAADIVGNSISLLNGINGREFVRRELVDGLLSILGEQKEDDKRNK